MRRTHPPDRPLRHRLRPAWRLAGLCALAAAPAAAQDGARGALLYLQLPGGVASCVSCHGPDPTQNRNRLLYGADRPDALLRALNTVGVMGELRSALSDRDVADLAAYLGRVLQVASDGAPLALWPATLEFGAVPPGEPSAVFRARLANRSGSDQWLGAGPRADPSLQLSHDCPATLAPGASCELRLQAPAGAAQDSGGAVAWPWPAGGAPLLTGWSASARRAGSLAVEPADALDFGPIPAGTRAERELVLRNTGPLPVTLGPATLTGPDRARYTLDAGCGSGTVLAPGQHCRVVVGFQPAVAGLSRAGLQWRSDGRNPGNLMLDGRAVAGAAAAPPPPPAPAPAPPPAVPAPPPPAEVPASPANPPTTGGGGAGGGCSLTTARTEGPAQRPPIDPMLPGLAVLSLLALWRRHRPPSRRRAPGPPADPPSPKR